MTTTRDLREYLDARGVDGVPTEPGWYVIFWDSPTDDEHVSVVEVAEYCGRLTVWVGGSDDQCMKYADCITRHAPLTLAPPAGRQP